MQRAPMTLYWWNEYSKNDYTTKSNLQIQFNPIQNPDAVLYRNRRQKSSSS